MQINNIKVGEFSKVRECEINPEYIEKNKENYIWF